MRRALFYIAVAQAVWLSGQSFAQHPIDVERTAARGEYFEALAAFDRLPERRVTMRARLAAADSAWGISLPERAIQEYDRVLQDETLASADRARLYMLRGAIELQEGRLQVATLFAERSVLLLQEPSPLRAQALMLWGQSLMQLGVPGQAEEKFVQALTESAAIDKGDVHFQLAECQMKLGKFDEARRHFEQVPLQHARTAMALRHLAELSLKRREPDHVIFWLTKGRADHARDFLDSWVDYALVTAAIQKGDTDMVKELSAQAATRFPPSDHWLTLLQAASESYLWQLAQPQLHAAIGQEGAEHPAKEER